MQLVPNVAISPRSRHRTENFKQRMNFVLSGIEATSESERLYLSIAQMLVNQCSHAEFLSALEQVLETKRSMLVA